MSNLIKNFGRKNRGFTLVELLVVVAIVALLSVSAVIGFGSLGNSLRARQASGFLEDVVKREEMKVLRGDFDKATIHFLSDFLAIEEWPKDAVEGLAIGDPCTSEFDDDFNIVFKKDGNLTLKDGEGEIVTVKGVLSGGSECVAFKNSHDLEWIYELRGQDPLYNSLHFTHFNLDRENLQSALRIVTNGGSKVEILSPYGKKRLFKNCSSDGLGCAPGEIYKSVDSLKIEVGNEDGSILEAIEFR